MEINLFSNPESLFSSVFKIEIPEMMKYFLSKPMVGLKTTRKIYF